jgi:hypothetical protein
MFAYIQMNFHSLVNFEDQNCPFCKVRLLCWANGPPFHRSKLGQWATIPDRSKLGQWAFKLYIYEL